MSHATDGSVLLTGATGFVGMELLARFLERGERHVYALVRASDDEGARSRLHETLETVGVAPEGVDQQVTAVAADIEHPGLGVTAERHAQLAESVTAVIHSAASVSFTLPLHDSRRINVGGTRAMLDFAAKAKARGGLERFAYVSTAYVAGTHQGEFSEPELDVAQGFRNSYERSKYEAETLVRERAGQLPVQVYRPSIVVGERSSGWTASFNVLYSPLKAFVRGALPFLPADRHAPVDVVPVDYVTDAIYALSSEPVHDSGETFHLVSGDGATTVERLAARAASHLERSPPRIVAPALYRRLLHPLLKRTGGERRRRALKRNEVFFPYFTMRLRFDDRRARRRLAPRGIEAPPVERYLDRLIDFARAADWGRRPIPKPPARSSS
jgi:thioester reductase-like protein